MNFFRRNFVKLTLNGLWTIIEREMENETSKQLPVYKEKERILHALEKNSVIIVQSPTGSGKTTQLPVILYESRYAESGIIAVTQPRRIAALSVSSFIAKELGTTFPGTVGYKMRFEDKTDETTKIKIMTDGMLLQELKLDSLLSRYSVIMVDEAHERSLNIDFILGLLKRILKERSDLKVIISSATMNAESFSAYFSGAPVITIETPTFPVTMIYDAPVIKASTASENANEALMEKISLIVGRILDNKEEGATLIFLPGERAIKDCISRLESEPYARNLFILPLYGRLSKEEQERIFLTSPYGKKKIIVSTNIAETSVTIPDVTSVIDSGLSKLNFYNPHTFSSSLNECAVSKAASKQRRGRAGRTQSGVCYRLYTKEDFESREEYTVEEIYRTDLSEVVLQMADLGISEFSSFDFISPPGRHGIKGAVETLVMLGALKEDNTLSKTGRLMCAFPLEPRISRIIVESITRHPAVLEEVLIASAFLSARSPFMLPEGEEMKAKKAHSSFNDNKGDFVSYLKLFRAFKQTLYSEKDEEKVRLSEKSERFCAQNYLDKKIMAEIANIVEQLEEIISNMGIPILSGGSTQEYLTCIASGMIQFIARKTARNLYSSLTERNISIHPSSVLFKSDPEFIVAGEVIRTSRMFCMSVSPLSRSIVKSVCPSLLKGGEQKEEQNENSLKIGDETFEIRRFKGKRTLLLPIEKFKAALKKNGGRSLPEIRSALILKNGDVLMRGERLDFAAKIMHSVPFAPLKETVKSEGFFVKNKKNTKEIVHFLPLLLRPMQVKNGEYGFLALKVSNDGRNIYRLKAEQKISKAISESLSALENLMQEDEKFFDESEKNLVGKIYRKLNELYSE